MLYKDSVYERASYIVLRNNAPEGTCISSSYMELIHEDEGIVIVECDLEFDIDCYGETQRFRKKLEVTFCEPNGKIDEVWYGKRILNDEKVIKKIFMEAVLG